ncbi:MAG: monofunctional biosynthetic peptidoglycan transglycosylase [Nitrospiraceae bacterium]|nr:monofunctional biosynthetic peptidoglycan transglycosylase [Nitrospiraceae bacterium]
MKKIKLVIAIFLGLMVLDLGMYLFYPNVRSLRKTHPVRTAFMRYREKEWKKEGLHKKITQRWVPYSDISPYLKKAVLIGEDDKFWHNDGFELNSMEAAMVKDIKAGKFKFGASTVTQQLARNLYLSPSKTLLRKMKEAILTWRINRELSKKRILELYLNVAEWGDGIFGIGAASYHYYGKPASALTPSEAARLASILPNPVRFSPLKPDAYVKRRSKAIYDIMVRRGVVRELDRAVTQMEEEGPSGMENSPSAAPVSNGLTNAPVSRMEQNNQMSPQNQQPSP